MPKPLTDTTTPEPTTPEPTNPDAATPKWERVERERLTRRAALRKMGYTSGIALFSMFAVDDLARMAITQMEQHKETRQIAETVAREFKNAGIALAGPNSSSDPIGCQNNCDRMLLNKLKRVIPATDFKTFKACVSGCVQSNPTDPDALKNCIEEKCITPDLSSGYVIRAKAFLECCYSACDSGDTGAKCKF